METLTQLREPADSPATTNSNLRWVMLNCYGSCWNSSVVSDARTTAASARTSTGRHLLVSFGLAAPPATSSLYYEYNRGGAGPLDNDINRIEDPVVIAAGDAAVLLEARVPDRRISFTDKFDYFLYDSGAGAGAGRPPSLALLPARRFPMVHERGRTRKNSRARRLHAHDTGLLRRGGGGGGDDGILVAQLEKCYDYDSRMPRGTAELCLLRPGSCEWELIRDVPIVGDGNNGEVKELLRAWDTDAVVAVGGRFLCWVDYLHGFLVWDTAGDGEAASSPKLLYVRLPGELPGHGRPPTRAYWIVSAAGTGAVRLVSVGVVGGSTCACSRYTFTVTIWTLSLTGEKTALAPVATWVRDCVLDCDELWALPGYEGLPCVPVEYPILCSDDDVVVYFIVRNDYGRYLNRADRRVWMIEVDMKRKTLRSVVPYTAVGRPEEHHVLVKL